MVDDAERVVLELAGERRAEGLAWGPADGRPVLGLHGWLDNAATYTRLAPQVVASMGAVRFVALDLPGHGLSAHRPARATYHFIDWVADVLEAVDALGWSRFGLVGHSMGANIGVLLAGAFRDRVERLVLLDGLGPLTTEAKGAPARLRMALEQERRPTRARRVYEDIDAAVRRRVELTGLGAEAARVLVTRGVEAVEGGGVRFRHDPRLTGHSRLRLTEAHVLAFLEKVECPTLAVLAEQGLVARFGEVVEGRLTALSDGVGEIARVEGGHHVHLEQPERVVELVVRGLGE